MIGISECKKITTFNQVVGGKRYVVSMPVTRVEKILERVDLATEMGDNKKALKMITPFIMKNTKKVKKMVEVTNPVNIDVPATTPDVGKKGAKRQAALELIAKLQEFGRTRSQIIEQVKHDLEMTYANARHYVVNVAKVEGN